MAEARCIPFKEFVVLQRGFDLTKKDMCEGLYPVIGSTSIIGHHKEYKAEPPGVITGRSGSLGVVQYIREKYWPHNTALWVKDFKGNIPHYVYYYLQTLNLGRFNSGAGVPTLNRNDLDTLEIAVHPLSTQRKIAAILSAYDDLIENNMRRIKILEEMAQALYREWFVNFRFQGHEKVKMVESEMGIVPEGWEIKKLGGIADINASSLKKGYEPDEINYIDIASVSTGQIDKIEHLAFADAPSRARRIVKHGDIIWSTVRPNRKSYSVILSPPSNLIVSTGFAVITPKHAPYTYLYHALTTDDFVGYLINHTTGAAYPAVNSGDFENALILHPPNALLELYHTIVGDLFDYKQIMQQKNLVLCHTRDLLLPKLISGEVDVENIDVRMHH
ncbi:MAG: restriction endonuclease subunit S [Candidatus Methanoperedens sp.]|nr:restriction endonuclease subunit S [Candidatus Methanoperedens sp.]